MTLYEIDQSLLELMESVDPETGEWTGDPEAWEALLLAKDKKVENTALLIKNLKAEAVAIKAEVDVLSERKKRLERKIEWLEGRLKQSLAGQPFETAKCSIKFRHNQESVTYINEADTMAWAEQNAQDLISYGKPTLSKTGIKKLLQEGEEVPGAELVRTISMKIV